MQCRQREPLQRGLETGAQHSVDNQVGLERVIVPCQILRGGNDSNLARPGSFEFTPGYRRIAFDLRGRTQQNNRDRHAGVGQQPRRHHAVPAIVAAPAQDRDAFCTGKLLLRQCHNRRGRMAHQIDGWNSEPLGGRAVAGLHFLSGENVHGSYGSGCGRDGCTGRRKD